MAGSPLSGNVPQALKKHILPRKAQRCTSLCTCRHMCTHIYIYLSIYLSIYIYTYIDTYIHTIPYHTIPYHYITLHYIALHYITLLHYIHIVKYDHACNWKKPPPVCHLITQMKDNERDQGLLTLCGHTQNMRPAGNARFRVMYERGTTLSSSWRHISYIVLIT